MSILRLNFFCFCLINGLHSEIPSNMISFVYEFKQRIINNGDALIKKYQEYIPKLNPFYNDGISRKIHQTNALSPVLFQSKNELSDMCQLNGVFSTFIDGRNVLISVCNNHPIYYVGFSQLSAGMINIGYTYIIGNGILDNNSLYFKELIQFKKRETLTDKCYNYTYDTTLHCIINNDNTVNYTLDFNNAIYNLTKVNNNENEYCFKPSQTWNEYYFDNVTLNTDDDSIFHSFNNNNGCYFNTNIDDRCNYDRIYTEFYDEVRIGCCDNLDSAAFFVLSNNNRVLGTFHSRSFRFGIGFENEYNLQINADNNICSL